MCGPDPHIVEASAYPNAIMGVFDLHFIYARFDLEEVNR
jgi:hypothetical protein